MKRYGKIFLLWVLALALISLTACSGGEEGQEAKAEEVLIPVSVNGTEIRVGETTVQPCWTRGWTSTGWTRTMSASLWTRMKCWRRSPTIPEGIFP